MRSNHGVANPEIRCKYSNSHQNDGIINTILTSLDTRLMKAIIYCRVSTKEQTKNLSLSTQRKACIEYCKQHDIKVNRIFMEEGESAKTADRPEFQKLLAYCRDHKDRLDYLIVYAINRFARDKYDHWGVRALLAKYEIKLRSFTEPIDDTATGKLMEGVLSAFAQFDNDVRSERTVTGMKAALEKGQWPFQPPLGYIKPKQGNFGLMHDPETGPLVRKGFELFATGQYTVRQVLKGLTALGLRTRKGQHVTAQSFGQILRNKAYIGLLEVSGWGSYQGAFEPLVDEATFYRVQSVLSGKRPTATPYQLNHPDFPLRRFVKCGTCGTSLTGGWSTGRRKRYAYYRCPNSDCKLVKVSKDDLEGKFIDLLESLQPTHESWEAFKEHIKNAWEKRGKERAALHALLEEQIEDLKSQKSRLTEALICEQLDNDTFKDTLAQLNAQLEMAHVALADHMDSHVDPWLTMRFSQNLLLNLADQWKCLCLNDKQRLQRVILPFGLRFDNEKFGTAETTPVLSMLSRIQPPYKKMASPTGFEPVVSVGSLAVAGGTA